MRGLSYEYRDSGVTFQCLMPFYVATRMTSYSSTLSNPSVVIPSARTYVRHAMATLGWSSRTTGYLPHTIQVSNIFVLSRSKQAFIFFLFISHNSMSTDSKINGDYYSFSSFEID